MIADGAVAPNFTLDDLEGKEIELTDVLTLYPVMLIFFRSDCELCVWALPQLARYEWTFGGGDLAVYHMTPDHPEVARATLKALRLEDLRVLPDPEGKVTAAFGVEQLPAVVFIYPDSTVAAAAEGWEPDEFTRIGKLAKEQLAWIRGPEFGAPWRGDPCPVRTP